ncbi:MAG: flagellin FliC [Magnetococcales bacterium]|nr:flagellin FliC [Magnetococcales bacterium]
MALTINSNIAAMVAQRHLQGSTRSLNKTFQRLASGLRVNGSTDDAAGLSIATGLTAQVRGMNQAIRNTNDAISLIQVAEGAMDETQTALQRIRELAIQAANDTYTTSDRSDIWDEVNDLVSEINRIATSTKFNSKMLLNGAYSTSSSGLRFQVGAEAGQTIRLTVDTVESSAIGMVSTDVWSVGTMEVAGNFSAQQKANSIVIMVDSALASVSDIRAGLGSAQNRLESTISSLANVSENTSAARSRIMDADIAMETSNLTRNSILQQAGTAILAQANQQPQLALLLLG